MKLKMLIIMGGLFLAGQHLKCQLVTQTIRGTLLDEDGKFPLIGATIIIAGTDPVNGTVTDAAGVFRLDNVPVGRVDLELRYIGYEDKIIPNILANSGKEVVLDLEMRESFLSMDEVVVTAGRNKGEVLNEMAMISSRSFSVEETKRYAGSFQDPSRMVSAFAGVSSDPSGNNDIIVRGNSPKGILWRFEGIEIPNPNHFANEGTTGGPINALNSELLSNSDFYTGAFSPEYGDVLSGVFDIHMRCGNNEKREYSLGVGVLGTDIMLEGPFSKNYGGSYLVNYRYSSLAMLNDAGLVDFDGVPKYQDGAFKLVFPANRFGTFSLFGLGGISHILQSEEDDSGKRVGQADFAARLGVVGLNHTLSFNRNTFMKITLSASANGSRYDYEEPDSLDQMEPNGKGNWEKSSLRTALLFSTKLNAQNRIVMGIKFTRHYYNLYEHYFNSDLDRWVYAMDMNRNADTWQSYVSWKWRLTDDLTMVSGVHGIYFSLNDDYNIEPRLGLKWQIDQKQTVHMGFGIHSKAESIAAYYTILNFPDGKSFTPNTGLGLSKARHYVIGYEFRFTKNLNSKIEFYYQDLYNIPVEDNDTSFFTILNSDEGYIDKALVNDGTGYNLGIELTLERYFANRFYFLFTSSIYDSKYRPKDEILRNTKYNGNYSFNLLAGKEFYLGKGVNKKVLGVNTKLYYNGGRRYIPVKLDESRMEGETVYDFSKAWDERLDNILQVNLCVTFRINRPRTGHEFIIDIANLTGAQGRTWEYYNKYTDEIAYYRQLNFLPNIMYRVHF